MINNCICYKFAKYDQFPAAFDTVHRSHYFTLITSIVTYQVIDLDKEFQNLLLFYC